MQSAPQKKNSQPRRLLQTLAGEATPQVPFWLMRQAGRYLPEYRQLRQQAGSFLGLCFNPELAAEVTLQPLCRFDMDAAILFSDILVVPYALGQELSFIEGEGPRLGPFAGVHSFARTDFSAFDEKLQPVYDTLRRVRARLPADKTLLGFAGAPWTIACYMIQGHGDGEFAAVKRLAFADPVNFDTLIDSLARATAHYLINQVRNGADTVQIFDSWAGLLPAPYFGRWVVQPTRTIVTLLKKAYPTCPVIGFPRQAGGAYPHYAQHSGVDAVGLDQYYPLPEAIKNFGARVVLQGNLDPALLLAGGAALEEGVRRILGATAGRPFIFNLGHGVIKETPPEHVAQLARIIQASRR